jgi:predicted ribonuclease toxin of YeeF-YezG toxin-antitoxin module
MLSNSQENQLAYNGADPKETYNFKNIMNMSTTVVKGSSGKLHAITVNTTAAATITIYDNTSAAGTKIGILKASVVEGTYFYNCSFDTGLTIVTAGAPDITVIYK